MMIDENKQRWNKHKTDLINQIGNKWVFFFMLETVTHRTSFQVYVVNI